METMPSRFLWRAQIIFWNIYGLWRPSLNCSLQPWRPAWRLAWRVETLIFLYGDPSPLKAFVNCALLLMEREAVKTQSIEVIYYIAWWKCKNPSFSREVHKPYFWPNSLHGVTATSGTECLKRRDLLLKCICCVLELLFSDCVEDQLWIWRVKLLQKCWCFCNYYASFTILLQSSTFFTAIVEVDEAHATQLGLENWAWA